MLMNVPTHTAGSLAHTCWLRLTPHLQPGEILVCICVSVCYRCKHIELCTQKYVHKPHAFVYEVFVCTHISMQGCSRYGQGSCVPMCWNTCGGDGNYRVLPCKLWTFHLPKLDLMCEAGSDACSGDSTSFKGHVFSSNSILISVMEVSGEENVPGNQKVKEKKVKTRSSSSEHPSSMSQAQKSPN